LSRYKRVRTKKRKCRTPGAVRISRLALSAVLLLTVRRIGIRAARSRRGISGKATVRSEAAQLRLCPGNVRASESSSIGAKPGQSENNL